MQSKAIRRNGGQLGATAMLSQEEIHVCALTGCSPQEFAKLKAGFAEEDSGLTD